MTQILKQVITKAGIKTATSKYHEVIRVVLIILVVVMVILSVKNDVEEDILLDDITDKIRPGTILYNTIDEMDDETQKKYLKSMKITFTDEPSLGAKFLNNLKNALIAGVVSEYAVNGNLSKPIGIISKTIIYTLMNSLMSLKYS